jgi:hypothetical protein
VRLHRESRALREAEKRLLSRAFTGPDGRTRHVAWDRAREAVLPRPASRSRLRWYYAMTAVPVAALIWLLAYGWADFH